jgi:hypothetical protein
MRARFIQAMEGLSNNSDRANKFIFTGIALGLLLLPLGGFLAFIALFYVCIRLTRRVRKDPE